MYYQDILKIYSSTHHLIACQDDEIACVLCASLSKDSQVVRLAYVLIYLAFHKFKYDFQEKRI